jgi:hypothetical protein
MTIRSRATPDHIRVLEVLRRRMGPDRGLSRTGRRRPYRREALDCFVFDEIKGKVGPDANKIGRGVWN